jgi:hypothetical protein
MDPLDFANEADPSDDHERVLMKPEEHAVTVTIDGLLWDYAHQRLTLLMRASRRTGVAVCFAVVLTTITASATAQWSQSARIGLLAWGLLLAPSAAWLASHVHQHLGFGDATRPIADILAPLIDGEASDRRVARLVVHGAVLFGRTMVRADEQVSHGGQVILSLTSIDDVPEEFKKGRDLWFSGWFGGEPQG